MAYSYVTPPVYGGYQQPRRVGTWDVGNPGRDELPTPKPSPGYPTNQPAQPYTPAPPAPVIQNPWPGIGTLPVMGPYPGEPTPGSTYTGEVPTLPPAYVGHGGGGGGGGGAPDYYAGLPPEYSGVHKQVFGNSYYTDAKNAQADYQNLTNTVGNYLGRGLTNKELGTFMGGFAGYAATLGRAPSQTDVYNFANLVFAKPPATVPVSYLKTSEL